ncbi:LacI family DNA-binding transcriptional regulator [Streptomyces sp. NPDC096934]|uniref:LacI family DNA-binding transcriptional regulator n=1 Tax=Streptomyces sp. NPDC096934 TaxID=3155551 RepID=UPI0033337B0F
MARVSAMTVSRALRNDPRVSDAIAGRPGPGRHHDGHRREKGHERSSRRRTDHAGQWSPGGRPQGRASGGGP